MNRENSNRAANAFSCCRLVDFSLAWHPVSCLLCPAPLSSSICLYFPFLYFFQGSTNPEWIDGWIEKKGSSREREGRLHKVILAFFILPLCCLFFSWSYHSYFLPPLCLFVHFIALSAFSSSWSYTDFFSFHFTVSSRYNCSFHLFQTIVVVHSLNVTQKTPP